MNIPLETVVAMLMENTGPAKSGGLYVYVNGTSDGLLQAESMDELAAKVRDYLSTLVPKPVNLSECEEGKPFEVEYAIVAYRSGEEAFTKGGDRYIGYAKNLTVICPAERGAE